MVMHNYVKFTTARWAEIKAENKEPLTPAAYVKCSKQIVEEYEYLKAAGILQEVIDQLKVEEPGWVVTREILNFPTFKA